MVKMYPSWFMFFVVVVLGLVLVFSGDNWFSVWLGFEVTLMGFLPMFSGGSILIEGLFKYFLIQAGGSGVFVFSFLFSSSSVASGLFILGMFMKLGVFPFYSWVPLVMSSLTWGGCLLLVTIQKLGPLFMVCMNDFSISSFLLLFSVFTILVGGIMGYNQSYMRSLMAYSSISHTGWLVASFICSFSVFSIYVLLYFSMLGVLFSLFSFLEVSKVVYSGFGFKAWSIMSLLILSLSGIPPFTMFYLKMGVVYYLVGSFYFYIPFILFGSVFSIYYYLTFVVPSFSVLLVTSDTGVSGGFGFLGVLFSFILPVLFFF